MFSLIKPATYLASFVLAATSLAASSQLSKAADPDAMRQLLQTNACENCDLSGANLQGLDLTEANLRGANLQAAQLSFANLTRTDLSGASLQEAEISGANFLGANLQRANFSNASTTNLCAGEYVESTLPECVAFILLSALGSELCEDDYKMPVALSVAITTEDDWLGALCHHASETGRYLNYGYSYWHSLSAVIVRMMGADFSEADLSGVDLSGADLRYAQLPSANLQDTNLTYALLMEAELEGAQNANFEQALLTKAEVVETLIQLSEDQSNRAKHAEGKTLMGSINRAQQVHYLENLEFAAQVDDLGLGILSETDAYRYDVAQLEEKFVINRAVSLQDELDSYLGIVYVGPTEVAGEFSTYTILCESAGASPEAAESITFEPPDSYDVEVPCPAGWEKVL